MKFCNDRGYHGGAIAPHLGLTNPFPGTLHNALPTVGALDRPADMHAGGQPLLEERSGNLLRLGLCLCGGGDLAKLAHKHSLPRSGFICSAQSPHQHHRV